MSDAITINLMRAMRQVSVRATEGEMGIKLKQVMLLAQLRDAGAEVPQQQLGDVCGLDANNLVLYLNELEVEELIERRRDPADRRRHNVLITKTGLKRLEKAEAVLAARESEAFPGLSADELHTLAKLLAKALSR